MQFGQVVDNIKTTTNGSDVNEAAQQDDANDSFILYTSVGIIFILCACICFFGVLYIRHVIKQKKIDEELDQMEANQIPNHSPTSMCTSSGQVSPTPNFVQMAGVVSNDVACFNNNASLTNQGDADGEVDDLYIDAKAKESDDQEDDELYIVDGQVSPGGGGDTEHGDHDLLDENEEHGTTDDKLDIVISDDDEEKADVLDGDEAEHATPDGDIKEYQKEIDIFAE